MSFGFGALVIRGSKIPNHKLHTEEEGKHGLVNLCSDNRQRSSLEASQLQKTILH
jgi:hypothetical protein